MPPFREWYSDQHKDLPLPQPSEVKGRTYAVTGANTGLGFECAKHLVALGAARVILGVRSPAKGQAALAAIAAAHPEAARKAVLEVWEVDLASLDSVEAFAARLAGLERLDALVNNAGFAAGVAEMVESGLEKSLVVNDVATFLLVLRTLPVLRATARKFGVRTRMEVVVSGAVLRLEEGVLAQPLKEDNIFEALSKDVNLGRTRYAVTKLLQTYAVQQLAALAPVSETGVIIDMVNPGLCSTGLARNAPWQGRLFIGVMRAVNGRTAEMGSRTLVHGAVAGEDSHGKYLSECEVKESYLPPWIGGKEALAVQKRVWEDLLATLAARGHKVDVESVLRKA